MTGRLYEKYGTYYAVLTYKDKNNNKARKWIPTGIPYVKGNKKKAETKLDECIADNKHLEYKENEKPLFTELITEWLGNQNKKMLKDKLAKSTYEGHLTYVKKHIIPYFEPLHLHIDEVTAEHIVNYYNYKYYNDGRKDKKKGGLSIPAIKKHSQILKQVLTEAVIRHQIIVNPAQGVPLPDKYIQEFNGVFLTQDEANVMLQAFKGHELQAMICVTLYYGLRRSEVLGLRWQAIDFDKNTLMINHTVVKNLSVEYKNKTKTTTSKKTYELLPAVKDILLKLKAQENNNRKTFGKTFKDSDYIFKYADGGLYRPDCITRSFQRVLKSHGLPPMRFHDLRHSTASILYDKDYDIKKIQDWMRHADIETTLQIYTHISELRKKESATNLNGIFVI